MNLDQWKQAVRPAIMPGTTGTKPVSTPTGYQPLGADPSHPNDRCCYQGPGLYVGLAHVVHPASRYCCCGEKHS